MKGRRFYFLLQAFLLEFPQGVSPEFHEHQNQVCVLFRQLRSVQLCLQGLLPEILPLFWEVLQQQLLREFLPVPLQELLPEFPQGALPVLHWDGQPLPWAGPF
jgi:hypothetical protein